VSLATSLPCHLAIRGPPQSLRRCTYAVQSALYFAQPLRLEKTPEACEQPGTICVPLLPKSKPMTSIKLRRVRDLR
jgi:hypothetical protein